MRYPVNYGFIPGTLAADGDPLDILVSDTPPLLVGFILSLEVLGLLSLRDREVEDVKILGRPEYFGTEGRPGMEGMADYLETIRHFYRHYKELEGKPVEIKGWGGGNEARAAIEAARRRYLDARARPIPRIVPVRYRKVLECRKRKSRCSQFIGALYRQ